MLLSGWRSEALFGETGVLVAAKNLVNDTTITVDDGGESVDCFQIHLDTHELIQADGLWSESFHPAAIADGVASEATRDEVLALFPERETPQQLSTARRPLSADEVAILL